MSKSSPFFFYTFHESFTDAENLALALELERLCEDILCSQFGDEFKREVDALRALLQHLPRNTESASLGDVSAKIRQLGITFDLFLAALISAQLSQELIENLKDLSLDERRKIILQFKPLVVLSCFRILEKGDSHNGVRRACDELRYVILGYKRINYLLPDLSNIMNLQRVLNSISFINEQHSGRYGGYYSCFKLACELRKPEISYNTPKRVFSIAKAKSKKARTKTFQHHQVKSGKITAQVNNRQLDDDFGKDVDAEKTNTRDYVGTVSLANKRKPTATTHYQARAISKRIASANRCLPTDIKQATKREIQVLLTVALKQIMNETEYETASKLLILSLLVGRNFNELQNTNFSDTKSSILHELKAQKYGHVEDYQAEYEIRLPKGLTKVIGNITLSIIDHEQQAKQLIAKMNKNYGTKLSLSKIERYIYTHLISCGVDKTMIALITGPNKAHQISLNYVTLDTHVVNAQFQNYVTDLKELCRCDTGFLEIYSSSKNADIIGSKAYVTHSELSELFLNMQMNISAQNNRQHRFLLEFHNRYTLYTYLLLSFTTGFRPVIDMFGYLRDYQISLGVVHIIDKEKGKKNEGRQVYFGEILRQQLQYYLAYCEFRCRHYKLAQPQLAKRYQDVLTSNAPLFFFINEVGEYESPRPSLLKQVFEEFELTIKRYQKKEQGRVKSAKEPEHIKETIPLNWHRHYVRSLLLNRSLEQKSQITESLANAWMGHDDRDNDIPLSRFSHMSVMDLKIIATLLDKHLQALGVRAIEAR